MVDSRQKGGRFEREVVKLISKYWGAEARRTPGSGNLHASGGFSNLQGDVVLEESAGFPFIIEAKSWEGWHIDNLLLRNGPFGTWYEQVVADTRRVMTADPLVIFKRNHSKVFVMLPYKNSLFVRLAENNMPVMATVVTYKHSITEKTENFLVLATTFEGFSSVPKEYYMENYGVKNWDWEQETAINVEDDSGETIKQKANNILDIMFGED